MGALAQNAAQQAKQFAQDSFETIKRQPGEMAGKVIEQMGGGTSPPGKTLSAGQSTNLQGEELTRQKAEKEAQSQRQAAQIVQQINAEIDQRRKQREAQEQQRRQPPENPELLAQEAPPIPQGKRPRGLFGLGNRRIQRVQEQTAPEKVGRRVGG
jgi:hypothetical protein